MFKVFHSPLYRLDICHMQREGVLGGEKQLINGHPLIHQSILICASAFQCQTWHLRSPCFSGDFRGQKKAAHLKKTSLIPYDPYQILTNPIWCPKILQIRFCSWCWTLWVIPHSSVVAPVLAASIARTLPRAIRASQGRVVSQEKGRKSLAKGSRNQTCGLHFQYIYIYKNYSI
jgi:hypothetical protein